MRAQTLVSFLCCLALLAVAARATAATESVVVPSGDLEAGRAVFAEKGCRVCHAVRGVGGTRGPDLTIVLVNKGVFAIAAGMWSHAPNMRKAMARDGADFPTLSPEEVHDLLSYLTFIGFVGEPGDASHGARVFRSKGCPDCHIPDDSGRSKGPPLEGRLRGRSTIAIAQQMWNHQVRMVSEMAALGLETPTFGDREMADLAAYLGGQASGRGMLRASPGDPVTGRRLFVSKGCAGCHLPTPEGTSVGPDLSTIRWYRNATAMAAEMWNHGPAMVAVAEEREIALPHFEGSEMADLLAYLYLLRSIEQVGDVERGKTVFASKHCQNCHDGDTGPDLTGTSALQSSPQLASAMWNHAPQMEEAMQREGFDWPTLTSADVADLLAFLRAQSQ